MRIKSFLITLMMLAVGSAAHAQGLGDLLKGLGGDGDTGSAITNALQGIFTKSDLTLDDIVGSYKSTGPAVAFKSDNFLQKAGGVAGAAAIETKLQPYYEQYGMIGMPLSIDKEGNFSMTVKKVKMSGNVIRNEGDGTFTFNVLVGGMKIGQFTAYVEKSGKDIDLMFDARKLKDLISAVGKFGGSKLTASLSKILDSYEGAYMGFKMSYTGEASAAGASGSDSTGSSDSGSGALDNLRNILNNRKK